MSSFKLYGSEAKKYSTITKEELIELFKDGTREAQNKIFKSNLGLISYVIDKHFYGFNDKEDLFQVGAIALWKTILSFNISKGFSFSTYATTAIISEIKRYIREKSGLIRIPIVENDLLKKIDALKKEYEAVHSGQELSNAEISKLLDVSLFEIEKAINISSDYVSFDQNIYSEYDNNLSIYDLVEDPSTNVFEKYKEKAALEFIYQKLNELSDRDRKVVKHYYGIKEERLTQEEISKKIGISRIQISKIVTKFRKTCLVGLGYDIVKKENNKENEVSKKRINKTIEEELKKYDPTIVKEELEKMKKADLNLLKERFDDSIELSINDLTKAKRILRNLLFNLAIKTIKNGKNKTIKYN